jgi:type IV secretory pathway VirJ component
MTFKKRLLAVAPPASASPCPALGRQAHRGWIVPSATVLSGDGAWVTLDAAVSNELFYADHNPMRLDAWSSPPRTARSTRSRTP